MDAARPDNYRILREADLRDYLAQLAVVAEVLGGPSADYPNCTRLLAFAVQADEG